MKAIRAIHRLLEATLVILMLVLVGSVTWQVLSRYLLGAPAFWTEELARFALVWVGVLGAAYAAARHEHLALSLLSARAGPRARGVLHHVSRAAVAGFALAVMVVGGGRLVAITWQLDQVSAALGVPMAMVYSVVPLSGCLIFLFALVDGSRSTQDASVPGHG